MTLMRHFHPFKLAAAIILPIFIMTAFVSLHAQSVQDTPTATDLKFHKFQPKVSPEQATSAAGQLPSAVTAQQIQALELEKGSRTPAQKKIDSNLLYTIRMLAGQPAAPGVPYLYTGVDLDENNNMVVDIVADVTDPLLQQLQAAGAMVLYSNADFRAIRAIVPPGQIENIAASSDVTFVGPKVDSRTSAFNHAPVFKHAAPSKALIATPSKALTKRAMPAGFEQRAARLRKRLAALLLARAGAATSGTGQGSVTTEGDATHRAFDARTTFGINGSGLKIGVLSDSANATGAAAAAQASGDLPPNCPGPAPCLTIVQDFGGGADEGTAMMEIIYDMAPGASLFFATADNGEASFAQNILDLRNVSGCDIIVDDVFYFDEPVFQDGIVAQAVNTVTASGALYFSSAGNEGNVDNNTAGYFEGDFNDAGSPAFIFPGGAKAGTVHNFGNNPSGDIITAAGDVYTLNWADAQGASANDYDLFVVSSAGIVKGSSTNIQSGSQNPFEIINPPALAVGDRLVVFKTTAAAVRFFAINTIRGNLTTNTTGQTHGHSAANGVGIYSVAATPAASSPFGGAPGPFPNPFNTGNHVETFTSDGPRRVFFDAAGTPITPGNFTSTGGAVRLKPDITGADGVSTTLPGASGLNPFFGTSAAAPSAASVAALVKSANPALTQTQVRTALTSTAIDIAAAGYDRDSGNGIVMAWEAVNSLGVPGVANPSIGTVTATENPGNGNGSIEAGEGVNLVIQLKNNAGVQAATGITAVLTTSTPGVTITQPNTTTYANLPAGTGVGNNQTPLTFTLASNFGCGLTVDFTLTITYAGGPAPTKALTFGVPTGRMATFTNNLGTLPTAIAGVTTATGTQTNRISRNGVASACGSVKAFPGAVAAANRAFDSYTITACQSTCAKATLTSTNGVNIFESAYSPSFDPVNIGTNYKGDSGLSGSPQVFFIDLAAATPYTFVVNDVTGTAVGSSYTLQFPACTFSCGANQVPVALVHNVTVTSAVPGGTAAANINNGSNDPDGDPITLTQTPAGPYPHGTTSVMLTVVDTKGATAQASAIVTVNDPTADLTITKTHSGNFAQRQTGATYTITATNSGGAATSGTVTVADTVPAGLTPTAATGTGWTCGIALQVVTCTRGDALAGTSSYPAITLTVDVANNAPASVTNTATVSGGGEVTVGNDSASDPTTITPVNPDLTITKTHSGNFAQRQTGATYTITVTNSGNFVTSGTVTVADTVPAGLTPTAASGTGWGCVITLQVVTCTRNDALAAVTSYPAITLTVDVSNTAPASVTNTATVSGGGEVNVGNDSASDPTTITPVNPDLTIAKTHAGNFAQNQTGATYTITASNSGNFVTNGTVTVVDSLPTGLTATAISGTGWTCVLGTLTCTRGDALAGASSYPTITVTVNVSNSASASVTNTATVSGGGEVNVGNDLSSNLTTITPVDNFTYNPTLPSVTVTAGQSVTEHITFTPTPTTGATITFSCSNLPSLTTCSFTPATVPPSTTPVDVAMTITTTATTTSGLERPRTFYAAWLPFTGLGLIGVVMMVGTRRKNRKAAVIFTAMALLVLLGLIGCGGGSPPPPVTHLGTPPGTYTVTTTAASPNVTHSTTFTLVVN